MTKRNIAFFVLAGAVIVAGSVIVLPSQPVPAAKADTTPPSACSYFTSNYGLTGEMAISDACNKMFLGQWNACVTAGSSSNCTYTNQALAFNCGMPASSGATTGYCLGSNTTNCIKPMSPVDIATAVGAVCPTSAISTGATSTAPAGTLTQPAVVTVYGPAGASLGSSVTIAPGGTYQFTDKVTGAPAGADTSVNWDLACYGASDLNAGSAALLTSGCGAITADGLYTAPTSPLPVSYSLRVRATTKTGYPIQGAAGYVTTQTSVGISTPIMLQFPTRTTYAAGASVAASAQSMRYIKVSVNTILAGQWISFGEVQAYDQNGAQITFPAQNVSVSNNWTGESWAIGPAGLVDNNIGTGWNSGNTVPTCNDFTFCPSPNSATVTVDLGSVKQVSRISVFNVGAVLGTMTLSGSADGGSYTSLGTFNAYNYGFTVPVNHIWIDYTLASGLFSTRGGSDTYTTPSASGAIQPVTPVIVPPVVTPTQPTGGTGGTGTTAPTGGQLPASQVNLSINPVLQGFVSALSSIAAVSNNTSGGYTGGTGTTAPTGGGSTSGTGATTGSTTGGGSCSATAAGALASALQTLQGAASILSSQNVDPSLLASVQTLVSAVAQVLSAVSSCI
jgi:hypothetical protein